MCLENKRLFVLYGGYGCELHPKFAIVIGAFVFNVLIDNLWTIHWKQATLIGTEYVQYKAYCSNKDNQS